MQNKVYGELSKEKYLKMPKAGTNPRGVEFSKEAIEKMLSNKNTLKIPINWKKEVFEYDSYKKWIEYWAD